MKTLNSIDLNKNITLALETSINWKGYLKHQSAMNSYRSAYFVYQVGLNLDKTIRDIFHSKKINKRQICFCDIDNKITGEWLLDIVWTEEYRPDVTKNYTVPGKIMCAIECESNTSGREFFIDFSKLLNVTSPIKIFLAGQNQSTPAGAEAYRSKRLKQTAHCIKSCVSANEQTDWFVCFWPSPKYGKHNSSKDSSENCNKKSIWENFNQCKDNSYSHLNKIYTYELSNGMFLPV